MTQEDKTVISNKIPEAQVIAEAIVTFQYNNDARVRLDMEPLETMIIPAITMIGTSYFLQNSSHATTQRRCNIRSVFQLTQHW